MAEAKESSSLHSDILRSIPEFSGEKDSVTVREFSEKVKTAKDLVGWEDKIAIAIVRLKLTGPARTFLAADPAANAATELDTIVEILISQYERKDDLTTLHHELARMSQYSSESMKEWGARIKRLGARFLRITKDSALLKEMLQSKFEQGARSGDMRRFLRWNKFESFDDMVSKADQEERKNSPSDRTVIFGASRMSERFVPPPHPHQGPQPWRNNQPFQQRVRQAPQRYSQPPANVARSTPVWNGNFEEATCWKCGKKGHLQRSCPTLQTWRSPPKRSGSCFNCGESNHLARNCPRKRNQGNAQAPSFHRA